MIQVDIEMPKDCNTCPFSVHYNSGGAHGFYCSLSNVQERRWGEANDDGFKFADCPISVVEHNPEDLGEVSDGYHTFNQLYHQRAVLFATIVNEHPNMSWKSFKHSDGHYCFDEDGEMFIVGIDTPEGPYTYHYHKKYWDLFKCKELECGKEWDGHTEKDVTRLLSLNQEPKTGYWIPDGYKTEEDWIYGRMTYKCPFCGYCDNYTHRSKCCPDCGKKLKLKKQTRSKEVTQNGK